MKKNKPTYQELEDQVKKLEGHIGYYPDGSFRQTYCVFQDVTEKKEEENELLVDQQILKKAQELGKIGAWEFDIQKNKLAWTRESYNIFGIPLGTTVDFDYFLNCVHPDDRDFVIKKWESAFKNDDFDIEHRLLINGTIIWVHEKAEIKFDEHGDAISVIGLAQDITAYKEVEIRLRKEEEKYKILADNTFDWEYWIDPSGNYNYVSPACKKITGYGPDEFINNPSLLFEITIPKHKEKVQNHFNRMTETNDQLEEFVLINKNNEEVWIEHSFIDIYDNEGKFTGRRGTNRDITMRKLAEFKLIASERSLSYTFKNSPSIICQANLNTGYYIQASHAVTTILGYSEKEFTSTPIIDLIHPDDRQRTADEIAEQLKGKETITFENRFLCKDGSYKWMEWRASKGDENGIISGIGTNIDERKKAEKELLNAKQATEDSELQFRQLFENMVQGFALHEMIYENNKPVDYRFVMINKAFEVLTGFNASKIIGKTVLQILPNTEQVWIDNYGKVAKTGAPMHFEQYSQEFERYYDVTSYSPKKDFFAVIFIDSTERRLQEIQLKDAKSIAEINEEKYRTITENIPGMVYRANSEGLVDTISNSKLIAEFNEKDFLTGEVKWYDIIHTDDKARVLTEAEILYSSETSLVQEYRIITKNKSVRHVADYKRSIFKDSKFAYVDGVTLDITAQYEYKQKLKQSDRVFNVSLDMFCIAGFDGYFKYLNPSWERTLGWSTKTLLSKPWLEFVHPDDKVTTENVKSYIVDGKEIYQFKNRYICKDGSIKWLSWNAQPFPNEHIMVGAVRDITESKRIENELIEAKEKAEESDRLKSAFLANMSHEIRTPMNGILGFADLLKEPGLKGETQQEYILVIEKAGLRMLNIINDIISISKIEAGQIEVNISESNINEQIEYIYTFFKKEVETKGIHFSYSNALPLKEATLKTDPEKVYAILTNLVKNAIKYSIKGTIDFGYHLIKVNEHAELEFYVKDTGIGIPEDRQDAIFERFIQADIADKMALQGAGLGLSISKAYVEMLGGKIWVESKKDVGSTFYFTLPYQNEFDDKLRIEKSVSDEGNCQFSRKLKILIAEDDEPSEILISIMVKDICSEYIHARTGREAVELCRNNPDINLILMDIQMPELNGYDATRQIRQFNKEVIIIAQTAFSLSGDKEKTLEAGCNDYITKPIIKDKLFTIIANQLNNTSV